jgi:sugar lactone lactonase YvrE
MKAPRRLAGAAAAALTLIGAACFSSSGNGNGNGGSDSATTETSTTTTTTPPGPIADQTPPKSSFGLAFRDNTLWIADFLGGQIVAINPDTGTIVKRLVASDGVSGEIDDLTLDKEGTVYWTGFNDGAIGRMSPNGAYFIFANVQPGANGIAFSPDGKTLYFGRAVIGSGLWQFDLASGTSEQIDFKEDVGNVNSFAVGKDGMIYGPRYGIGGKGELVKIDPQAKKLTVVTAGFDGPTAVKLSGDGTSAYVLSMPPGGKPALASVNLATKVTQPLPSPLTPLVDNLAVAPDGRIFVSSYNEPKLTVINTDGTTQIRDIGNKQ